MPEFRMQVYRYFPKKLFGFCRSDDHEYFFHLSVFQGDPPPILGERVVVEALSPDDLIEKAPRAVRVCRVDTPVKMQGVVASYDSGRGFGFVQNPEGVSYHLHESEILNGQVPRKGGAVEFYAGTREGKPRACHVMVLP